MCATFGTFASLTNISIPTASGHWSGLVTMIQENSLSVLAVVQSGGADTTFHISKTLAPGQHPARCSIYTVIEMADPWLDMMKNLSGYRPPFFFFFLPISFYAGYSSPGPITDC